MLWVITGLIGIDYGTSISRDISEIERPSVMLEAAGDAAVDVAAIFYFFYFFLSFFFKGLMNSFFSFFCSLDALHSLHVRNATTLNP